MNRYVQYTGYISPKYRCEAVKEYMTKNLVIGEVYIAYDIAEDYDGLQYCLNDMKYIMPCSSFKTVSIAEKYRLE